MKKQWRLIVGCAVLGLVVTVLIVLYIDFVAEFNGTLYTAFAILCPPALACIPLSEAMKNKGNFYLIWSFIGLTNAGLYATFGAVIAELQSKRN
jgi:membrane protease YdiL (CAAX protease family)